MFTRIKLWFRLRKEIKKAKIMLEYRRNLLEAYKKSYNWSTAVYYENQVREAETKLKRLKSY